MQMFAYQDGIRFNVNEFQTFSSYVVKPPRDNMKSVVFVTPFSRVEARACRVFKVTPKELRSDRRSPQIAFARQFIYYWATRHTDMNLGQIGRLLGHRDHSTVAHGRDAYPKKRAAMGRHLGPAR